MAELNLEVKLIATPWLSPSLLNNYYTKEEIGNLDNYVKEVEDPVQNSVYGRALVGDNIEWVPMLNFDSLLVYGVNNKPNIEEQDISTFERVSISKGTDSVEISVDVEQPGYIWFCTSFEVSSIVCLDSLSYMQPVEEQEEKIIIYNSSTGPVGITLTCYHTPKLISKTYKFKIVKKSLNS